MNEAMEEHLAPHGRGFYGMVAFCALLGGLFFAAVALTRGTDTPFGWRVGFAVAAAMFFLAMAQAGERVVRPEQALARTVELTKGFRKEMGRARVVLIGFALGGYVILSVVRHFGSWQLRDACDDLRILSVTLLALAFSVADLVGLRVFSTEGLFVRTPKPPQRHRRRRSGLTIQEGPR